MKDLGASPSEEWRAVVGYEGLYEVSSLGRVRSLGDRWGRARILKTALDGTGYSMIPLSKAGKRTPKTVHRLVAIAFHGDKRNALHNEVSHLDGCRTNARADNLKWVSKIENMAHKRLHGTHQAGDLAGHRILSSGQVAEIKRRDATARELALRYGVSRHAIYDIWQGKRWPMVAKSDAQNPSSGNHQ